MILALFKKWTFRWRVHFFQPSINSSFRNEYFVFCGGVGCLIK